MTKISIDAQNLKSSILEIPGITEDNFNLYAQILNASLRLNGWTDEQVCSLTPELIYKAMVGLAETYGPKQTLIVMH